MRFDWDDCSGASEYQLMLRRRGTSSYQQVWSGSPSVVTHTVATAFGDTVDWYVIARAGTARRNSAEARIVRFETAPPPPDPRLTWDDPITLQNYPDLATWPAQIRQRVEGRHSIKSIVESRVIVRGDNLRCSACHFGSTGSRRYMPPVAQGSGSGSISSTQNIPQCSGGGCRSDSWSGFYGQAFRDNGPNTSPTSGQKPAYLRSLLLKWNSDGRRP